MATPENKPTKEENCNLAALQNRSKVSRSRCANTGKESKGEGGSEEAEASSKPGKRIVDIHGLSSYLGVCINTIYSWVSQARIPSIKIGHLLRFDLDKIDAWIAEHERNVNSEAA